VVNTNVVNGLGTHPSYKLVPSGAIPMMFDLASPVFQRANVIGHTLWVTPNHPDERWPAGEFVNQSSKDTGLAGWPVMPVDVVSFWLKPYGFFDRNLALDVVRTPPDACHTDSTSAHH
jgi:primary-amine oxidase